MKQRSEQDWRARDDANTLINADEIRKDKKRLDMAKKASKEIIAEHEAVINKMSILTKDNFQTKVKQKK